MNRLPWAGCVAAVLLATASIELRQVVANDDTPPELTEILREALPRMGHRNWIVVADMAYPAQSRPGIKTIYVGGSHLQTLQTVLEAIDAAPHVRGEVLVDDELTAVNEQDAPGVTTYRNALTRLFAERSVDRRLHEQIIDDLDTAAKTFEVLILKTDMTIPYTSVFVRLDCGYWSADAEGRLRESTSDR